MLGHQVSGGRPARIGLTASLLICAAIPASGQVATISIVDSAGDVGRGSAVAYGPDGLALISYVDSTNGALKAAHCNDVACTTSVTHTLDGAGNVGGRTSIAFGPDGRGLISYQAGPAVKVAHCADAACASATLSTIEAAAGPVGTAIAVGTDGLGVVAYRGATGDTLQMAHCLDADCGSAAITGYPGRYGYHPTLTIGGDGLPLVACDGDGYAMHLGHCNDQACTGATFLTFPGSFPHDRHPSLTTRSDGLGEVAHIDYTGSPAGLYYNTVVARCTDAACSAMAAAPGGTFMETAGSYFDLALGEMPGDLPIIAKNRDNRLVVSRCPNAACSGQQHDYLDVPGAGVDPALAVSPAGLGLITYYDGVNQDLKAAYMAALPSSQISIGDVTLVEGDAGTTAAVLEVHQTGTGSASVDYATGSGTATAGIDYVGTSGTVVFPPGSMTQTITVQVIGDVNVEPDETFYVILSNPQDALIVDGFGLVTILDDDIAAVPVVGELAHGSRYDGDLAADPGPAANIDYFRIAQAPYATYEVLLDAISGDVQPIELRRVAADGTTVLQVAVPNGLGFSVSLRFGTFSDNTVTTEFVRVRSGGCTTNCGADDVYHLRAYETTLSGARFNNSSTQTTVLLLQNPTNASVYASIQFWAPDATLLATYNTSNLIPAKGLLTLDTSQIPALAGASGTVTVAHSAPYGTLTGKTVALEPATGFSFDTPLLPRPR